MLGRRGSLLRAGVSMAHPFETLTPDLVLDAVESIGFSAMRAFWRSTATKTASIRSASKTPNR
jgi:hypothetical protein